GYATGPAALFAAQGLDYPRRPMRLVRRLERGMRGGAVLTVEREWQIEFSAQGSGIVVVGEQVGAAVDAPDELAALARIEQSRSTADMFPILLGTNGVIAAAGQYTKAQDLAAAVSKAESIIANRPIPAAAKSQQMLYLSQLQRAGTSFLSQLPRDLFFPVGEAVRAVRPVELPGGLMGEFEMTYDARSAPGRGWLEHAVRHVVTRIGQSERQSREIWSMSAI
ncbi:MAG: hypothetical protein AAGE86_04500, partial [Pseudomonadota bacterium]